MIKARTNRKTFQNGRLYEEGDIVMFKGEAADLPKWMEPVDAALPESPARPAANTVEAGLARAAEQQAQIDADREEQRRLDREKREADKKAAAEAEEKAKAEAASAGKLTAEEQAELDRIEAEEKAKAEKQQGKGGK